MMEMDILSTMTAADLNPDALAKLEAKLMADLDMVRKVRALLTEHQLGTAVMPTVPQSTRVTSAPLVPRPPARPVRRC